MKKGSIFLVLLLFYCGQVRAQTNPGKAIFIILDGIPADVLEKVPTPAMDEIAASGGYARAYVGGKKGTYNETPTISAPGYMNLITGTWANKHNVVNNYRQSPNYNYHNIFRIAKKVNPELHTAIFSSWLDNRTVLVGEGADDGGGKWIDHAFDGLEKDTVTYSKGPTRFEKIDNKVAQETAKYIAEKGPDLSWVYLEYTDDVAHAKGDSEEFYESIKLADQQVAEIWQAIKLREGQGEDWMIVITTDHGRDAATGRSHGKQSERERTTWITTNQSALNQRFSNDTPAVVDILPSVLSFIGVEIPLATTRELDGVSFLGNVHATDLAAEVSSQNLKLSWKALVQSGEAKLYAAFTNDYEAGGEDEYLLLAEGLDLAKGKATVPFQTEWLERFEKSGFMKVILETPTNMLNYWVLKASAEND